MNLLPYDPRLGLTYKDEKTGLDTPRFPYRIGKMEFTWDDEHETVVCETPKYVSVLTGFYGPTMNWRRYNKPTSKYEPHQGHKECARRVKKLPVPS